MTPAPTTPAPVLVPPYAASAGIPAPALDAAGAAGWTRFEDEVANVTYTSPDGRCRLEFGPETERYRYDADRLWVAEYRPEPGGERGWAAHFGDDTPAEAIAAFVRVLTDPAGIRGAVPGYLAGAAENGADAVFDAAEANGWVRAVRTATYTGTHGPVHLSCNPAPPEIPGQFLAAGPHWRATFPEGVHRRAWTAVFTAEVPGEAITAFLVTLTDPAGLDPDRDQ
ncbi:DUF317 domain-containing protein [Actinospica sp. MGRD01-02]|uniref:DUF317 domain-containing protein n=1 Tax=Actinospica acidithermotolerans TaxID=2828514 RepID=A0A941EK82_9ACTN|nr:DUF317 domain-containing protein [Actinospica acidithermotolerans]MBR7830619.1 DUF317 domain-containing protein [Actinospica acidithermotolerans]